VSEKLLQIMGSRWTRLVLVSLILLGLQTTVLNDMRPFNVMIPVMLLFAVASGSLYGSEIGAISGLIIGVMYDCVLTTPLGLASLVFGAAAYVAGLLPFFIREPTWWTRAITIGIVGAAGELVFPLAQSMVGLSGRFQPHVVVVMTFVAVVGMIVAPLLLPVCRWTLKESLVG
jgi:rod shape-determining protein MreD